MKVGIITFHFPYNAGAALQCYALSKALKDEGAEVEIINYRPWYHQNRYTVRKNPVVDFQNRFNSLKETQSAPRRFAAACAKFMAAVCETGRKEKWGKSEELYSAFVKEELNEGPVYRTLKSLVKNSPKCDVYICGSDQIWNESLTHKSFDEAYFLQFGDKKVKRYSYAAGVHATAHASELKELLKNFDGISVRENYGEKLLKEAGVTADIRVDVDPTLLLKAEDYRALEPEKACAEEKYVMVYTMGDKESEEMAVSKAKELCKEKGLKLYYITPYINRSLATADANIVAGPREFLWFIDHADAVVSNSYHAIVLSHILDKTCYHYLHSKTGYRVEEFLELLKNKEERINSSREYLRKIIK